MDFMKNLYSNELKPRHKSLNVIQNHLEDSFCANYVCDDPLDFLKSPSESVSTIAIALSNDGETIASTHGDHTVKVFLISTGKLYRSFNGHPRTPWTVKYNPSDSNILSSGCLGFEVRVWDIKRNICLNLIRLSSCIITLAFHPEGDFIMISSGPFIKAWDWKEGMAAVYGGYPEGCSPYAPRRDIVHTRNIRAILFHPNGKYVFAAAPDPPSAYDDEASRSKSSLPSRLYSFPFSQMFIKPKINNKKANIIGSGSSDNGCIDGLATNSKQGSDESNNSNNNNSNSNINNIALTEEEEEAANKKPIQLTTLPTVISEIYLYSDGGLDISRDGHYFISGALTFIRKNCNFGNLKFTTEMAFCRHADAMCRQKRRDALEISNNNNASNNNNNSSSSSNHSILTSDVQSGVRMSVEGDVPAITTTTTTATTTTIDTTATTVTGVRVERQVSGGGGGGSREQQSYRFSSPPLKLSRQHSHSHSSDSNQSSAGYNFIDSYLSTSSSSSSSVHANSPLPPHSSSNSNSSNNNNNDNNNNSPGDSERVFRMTQLSIDNNSSSSSSSNRTSSSTSSSHISTNNADNTPSPTISDTNRTNSNNYNINNNNNSNSNKHAAAVSSNNAISLGSSLLRNFSSLIYQTNNNLSSNNNNNNKSGNNSDRECRSSSSSTIIKEDDNADAAEEEEEEDEGCVRVQDMNYFPLMRSASAPPLAAYSHSHISHSSSSSHSGTSSSPPPPPQQQQQQQIPIQETNTPPPPPPPSSSSSRMLDVNTPFSDTPTATATTATNTNTAAGTATATVLTKPVLSEEQQKEKQLQKQLLRQHQQQLQEKYYASMKPLFLSGGVDDPSDRERRSEWLQSGYVPQLMICLFKINIHDQGQPSSSSSSSSSSSYEQSDQTQQTAAEAVTDTGNGSSRGSSSSSNSNSSGHNSDTHTAESSTARETEEEASTKAAGGGGGGGGSSSIIPESSSSSSVTFELVQHRELSSALMRAVTSVKFSPTGRCAVLGFGVRKAGYVEDHPSKNAACEVIKFAEPTGSHKRHYTPEIMRSIALIANAEDEVNIAQFHMAAGYGIIYGTKQGKVRLYHHHKDD